MRARLNHGALRAPASPLATPTLAALVCLALAGTGWASQKGLNWSSYKMADGLPESACLTVSLSPQGKVLARALNQPLISELDGYHVQVIPAPDRGKSRIYESPGGQLWTVVPQGLSEFRDGFWVLHAVSELASNPVASARFIDPVPLCPVRQGLVVFALPDRLMEFIGDDPDRPHTQVLRLAAQTQLGAFSGFTLARDGGLWLAGARGLAKLPGPLRALKPETPWQEYPAPETLENFHSPSEDEEGGITAVAESGTNAQRVIVYFDNQQHWTTLASGTEKVRQAWRGPDQTFWGMTTLALFQGDGLELSEDEELPASQYFDVALAPNGAFWLATSDGLFRYAPLIWRSPASVRQVGSLVHCLTADQDGRLWFATGSRLFALKEQKLTPYPFPGAASDNLQARAIYPLKNGSLVLDLEDTESASDYLFRFNPARGAFTAVAPNETARSRRALGLLKDGNLCVESLKPDSEGLGALERFDGRRFEPMPDPPPIGTPLETLFTAQNGDLWLSGPRGSACFRDGQWHAFLSTDQTTPSAASCFVELPDSKIWCATSDEIWEFDGRNWSVLRRGFDRINALVRTREGSVWVASNSGLYRFLQGAWVQNGPEEGLPSAAVRQLCEDPRGQLWAGTARGLSLYHPEADADPPQAEIRPAGETGDRLPEGGSLTLTFTGQDRWKFTPSERLLYSYRLDERDWSAFHEVRQVTFNDLPAGKHYFQLRAMDRNGNMTGQGNLEPKPAQFDFVVVLPWFKETRLLFIALVGLGVALFFAGLAFNRHRRLLRSYADIEQKVAERTHQLELANRELLHSQKMTALGTLAAGIAHDFNNILSIIKGSAQIIEDNLENPDKIRTRADRIKTAVEQGAGIVKAMLGFSRQSAQASPAGDLNAVVDDTLKLLGDRFLREVQVQFVPGAALPPTAGSKDLIQQILLNFIFNAAESRSKEKRIQLATCAVKQLPNELVLPPAEAPAYLAVSVRDWGCGIPAANLPRIFEPFFTTKDLSTRRGTGLGLSMVYELAKKMGAGLGVESAVDQGSTFTLILPADGAVASAPGS